MTIAKAIANLWGLLAHNSAMAESSIAKAYRWSETIDIAASGTTAGTDTLALTLNQNTRVVGADFTIDGTTLASNATNYASVLLYAASSDGGVTTSLVASISNATVAITNGVARAMTLTAANVERTVKETLRYHVTKNDTTTTGLAVSAGKITVRLEELD